MTKQPKDHNPPFIPESSFGTSNEWKETWNNIAEQNRELIKQHIKDTSTLPSVWSDKVNFNVEEVTSVFTQTMKKLEEQAKSKEVPNNSHLVDVHAFLKTTIHHVQKKTITTHLGISINDKTQGREWDENPFFFLLQQSSLLNLQFLKETMSSSYKLDSITSEKLTLYTQRLVDSLSLTNSPFLDQMDSENSLKQERVEIFEKPLKLQNKSAPKKIVSTFQVGQNLGCTPGKVVFQNDLFQLICYEPLTSKVAKQPILLIPPWINKHYIFDLRQENSFVRWALETGLSVFIISWVNPDQKHSHKTLEDYVIEGVKEALDQVCKITNEKKVNVVGYCIGGILLSCLMAYLGRKSPIASATFIGTPFDYSKIDELGIFRCKQQHHHLQDYVRKNGRLEGHYMIQAFNLLKANDLIWSSDVNHYLLGQKAFPFDMLYWACDALRLPTKMHSTYIKEILIENRLMHSDGLSIKGAPIRLQNISSPLFIVASREDHIAPWRSVYPVTQVVKNHPSKFILSSAGHITGAFTHPNDQQYSYWSADHLPEDADDWFRSAKKQGGSWWEEWRQWLGTYENGVVPARSIPQDRIIEQAPGRYVSDVKSSTKDTQYFK